MGKSFLPNFFFFFFLFRATLETYGGSQAGGQIGATPARHSHHQGNRGSELHLQPTPQFTTTLDPNPRSEVRDQIRILRGPSPVR